MSERAARAARGASAPSARVSVRRALDWGELSSLHIRAREVAEGVYVSSHRSVRRGAGVEFWGFREYLPGDDLRWLDRRSMLRDERLVIRQFETETDRAVAVVVDASASMAFRGPSAPDSKLAFASLIAAALGRVALGGGDPVGLSFIGADGHARGVDKSAGREQFDRIVASLDAVTPRGDAYGDPAMLERALGTLARTCRRGDVVVLLSDLLDESDGDAQRVAALASRGCVLSVVQVLDPAEVELPYRGTVRFRALEGTAEVEIDADRGRREYRARLGEISDRWKLEVTRRGGRFQIAQTSDDPVQVVRTIVQRLRR